MKTISFIDLFDFEKESDVHYYSMIRKQEEEFYLWEQEERNKKLPAIIQIVLPNELIKFKKQLNDKSRQIH